MKYENFASDLLPATIAWTGHHSGDYEPEGLTVSSAKKRIAKLAQELIEEHHNEAARIADLCRATGVGVRTLQRCFSAYFDLAITD